MHPGLPRINICSICDDWAALGVLTSAVWSPFGVACTPPLTLLQIPKVPCTVLCLTHVKLAFALLVSNERFAIAVPVVATSICSSSNIDTSLRARVFDDRFYRITVMQDLPVKSPTMVWNNCR